MPKIRKNFGSDHKYGWILILDNLEIAKFEFIECVDFVRKFKVIPLIEQNKVNNILSDLSNLKRPPGLNYHYLNCTTGEFVTDSDFTTNYDFSECVLVRDSRTPLYEPTFIERVVAAFTRK